MHYTNPTQALERMREVMRRQHKALSTEECYLFWLRRYIKALPKMQQKVQAEFEKELSRFFKELDARELKVFLKGAHCFRAGWALRPTFKRAQSFTLTGEICQMRSQYSRMARSEEK